MRPLAILNGIILGSSVAIALGLGVTVFIFYLLIPEHPEMKTEFGSLLNSTGIFMTVSAVAALAFAGQVMDKRWKWIAEAGLVLALAVTVLYYLPA